jgi:hypothetical protein
VTDAEEPTRLPELTALVSALQRLVADQKAVNPLAKALMETARDAVGARDAGEEALHVERRFAERLTPVAEGFSSLVSRYTASFTQLDAAVRALVFRLEAGGLQPAQQDEANDALAAMLMLVSRLRQEPSIFEKAAAVLAEDVAWSADLRRVLEAVMTAMRQRESGEAVVGEWKQLIDKLPGGRSS